jgi:hypothetical protein
VPDRFRLPLRAATPIDGLYFSGQDLSSCGIGGALLSGALSAGSILTRDVGSVVRARFGAAPKVAPSTKRPTATATSSSLEA